MGNTGTGTGIQQQKVVEMWSAFSKIMRCNYWRFVAEVWRPFMHGSLWSFIKWKAPSLSWSAAGGPACFCHHSCGVDWGVQNNCLDSLRLFEVMLPGVPQ